MKPYSTIRVMDVYKNPMTASEWLVTGKNDEEKLVQLVLMTASGDSQPIWKRNTDRVFSFPQVQVGVE